MELHFPIQHVVVVGFHHKKGCQVGGRLILKLGKMLRSVSLSDRICLPTVRDGYREDGVEAFADVGDAGWSPQFYDGHCIFPPPLLAPIRRNGLWGGVLSTDRC